VDLVLKRNLKEQPLKEEEVIDLKKKRNSNIVWLNDKWIYKEIHPYVHEANKLAGWNFDWNFSESCQFTKYKLKSAFYDWHMLIALDKPYDNVE
jgi:PKHD-type hydroxylase